MKYIFYSPRPNFKNRVIKITIPKQIRGKIQDKFVEISINKKIKFFYKLGNDKSFVVSKKNLNKKAFTKKNRIRIRILEKVKRKNYLKIINNKIDLMGLIPLTTKYNFEIYVIKKRSQLICLYKSFNGRLRQIKISRFAPLNFCRFLGYYQAEGGKRKQDVVITNTNLALIKDFLKISNKVIDPVLWKAEIKFSKSNKTKKEYITKELCALKIPLKNIKIRKEKNLRDFSIRLSISSQILSEIIINSMDLIRKNLKNISLDLPRHMEIYIKFIQGLFAGDGNYNAYTNKQKGTHHRLCFYEGQKLYAQDYQRLLKKIGLDSKIIESKKPNLYIVRSTLNWNSLLKIKSLELFKFHEKHEEQLRKSIQNHKRYNSQKYLVRLPCNFNIEKVCRVRKDEKVICYNWINKLIKQGIFIKNDKNNWSLTKEGEKIKNILSDLN
ncbi:MAG: LAGLIDADG family homing endonuclease [Nanoarchaeota archaeon]